MNRNSFRATIYLDKQLADHLEEEEGEREEEEEEEREKTKRRSSRSELSRWTRCRHRTVPRRRQPTLAFERERNENRMFRLILSEERLGAKPRRRMRTSQREENRLR